MRNKIIKLARREVGYKEEWNNHTKYGEWYGMQDEWCAIFISWLANEAGVLNNLIPKMAYVPLMVNWFKEKCQYKARGLYPATGDIIFFDYNHNGISDHVGIVEKCESGIITTIEGNKNNMVQRCTYRVNSKDILGYGIPKYIVNVEESEEEDMVDYQNGSTVENVYETTSFIKKIGSLNTWEKCKGKKIAEVMYLVLYKITGTNTYKSGFVKYHGGIK